MIYIPELPHNCNSWVVKRLDSDEIIGEFFERSNVEKFDPMKHIVITTLDHLQRLNVKSSLDK